MEANSIGPNLAADQNFILLKVKEGKYYVKFPNMQVPVVMNKTYYDSLLANPSEN